MEMWKIRRNIITEKKQLAYAGWLRAEEKAEATIEKYSREVKAFADWLSGEKVTKEAACEYKKYLIKGKGREAAGVNAAIAALNSFFSFMAWDIKLKPLKIQRQTFRDKDRVLIKAEYKRLLKAAKAKGRKRLYFIMQTICSTGIRVSELIYITLEAVCRDMVEITNKGKTRTIFIPEELKDLLLRYADRQGIQSGCIFITKSGKPVSRSNIWAEMKKLCEAAGVNPEKVYPHNLRALFARAFYGIDKDIAKLADILGHSSIDTTRIYLRESGEKHREKINSLGLVMAGTAG